MSVELVEGYGVVILKKQLDAAIMESKNSPTKLIRYLLSSFFTPEVLPMSSVLGL